MLRIKQLRCEHNLSQRALAQKIGASQKAVDLWEKGINEPKAGIVAALANVFECTTDYLLGREDDMGTVNVMRELTDDEKLILTLHASLDKREREEAVNFMRYLITKK